MPPMKIPGPIAAKGLYRMLLRAHQKHLPNDMKALGDEYVKSEFKLHKNVKKHDTLDMFYTEWLFYLNSIESAARARATGTVVTLEDRSQIDFGRDLPPDIDMDEEQMAALEKLKQEAYRFSLR